MSLFKQLVFLFLLFPVIGQSQQAVFSDPFRGDTRDMNFEIIGKIHGNVLVFKNVKMDYEVSLYKDNMELIGKTALDFLPQKTFNVDFVAYPDFFYLFYQYHQKGVVHCMAVKMNAMAEKMAEPVELDTTAINMFGDHNIYSLIYSENKQKIALIKTHKKDEQLHFVSILYNSDLTVIHKYRDLMNHDERREVFSNFLVDNDGNIAFAKSAKERNSDFISGLQLDIKHPLSDSFTIIKIPLSDTYIDEVKVKIDNVNHHYLLNSLFYTERNGNIAGLFSTSLDSKTDSTIYNVFNQFSDSLRSKLHKNVAARSVFNDLFIHDIIVKKDGGLFLFAEDYSTVTIGSGINNRWDPLGNSMYNNSYNYYYNPVYSPYYRPFNSFNTNQTNRYFYGNILIMGINKEGVPVWSDYILKDQDDVETDNFLSYSTIISGGKIHIVYNNTERSAKLLTDNMVSVDGEIKRNPPIKSYGKEYEFMPRFAKQVDAGELIVPCTFRNMVCFARISF